MSDQRPLIAHVVYSFRVGGLENGIVNLINRLPRERFRHAVIALTDIDAGFRSRITRGDVEFVELHKAPGPGVLLFPRLAGVLRALRPALVHTRNLAALEMSLPAWFARVPVRLHGEHGRDVDDPDGRARKPRRIRRLYRPFVTHYIALSVELSNYLTQAVGISAQRVDLICNGVDSERFRPAWGAREALPGSPFNDPALCVIGTVGRLQAVKDQAGLVRAFARVRRSGAFPALRLVLVGEGAMRTEIEETIREEGVGDAVWLAGERADVPQVMRGFDLFALPSLAEGISNTVLEAMACGLPVVATAVGGNPELVEDGVSGALVPASDTQALASALAGYASAPELRREQGRAGRRRIEAGFSLAAMVDRYEALYVRELRRAHVALPV
ncbi:TIGR03088 family PEP-CTERM/XrtA system glycosyltransferase [Niveibacterium terrae]|uniref:TIGR03088 family PEP-CTERM/XrtA system glycosyltransferase n=1 Tax=Niveibacterium terrae TaxID=3373598 RepID=UPI003A8D634E